MFRDEQRTDVWNQIREHGIRAFAARLTPTVLAEAAARAAVTIGRSPLNLANLVWLGVAGALAGASDFATVLTDVLRLLEDQPNFGDSALGREKKRAPRRKASGSRHSPHRRDRTLVSEEAFCKARARMPLEFWMSLIALLVELFQVEHRERLKFHGFRLLAMDGTEIDLPNWAALRTHFGQAKNKSGQHKPQARMVMLQFPLVRLPYRYELTPVSVGENTTARRLVQHLQALDLVLLDAGFWSYGLLCDIQQRHASFALRKKSGLKFRTLRKLGRDDHLVEWTPCDSRGKWRDEGLPPSIRLRVIRYQVPGYRVQELVTNVCDPRQISHADWVRLTTDCEQGGRFTPGVFHRRWEIETTYRELKIEQGLEQQLRSRTPASIQYEVASHVVLYLLVRWMIVEAAAKHGLDPLQLSFKHALRELQQVRAALVIAAPHWVRTLLARLLDRIANHLIPFRPGRHYVRKKKSTNYKRKSNTSKPTTTTKPQQG